ncbi:hypothetical protein ACMDB5_10520 [Flavobacterium sp. W1B]|uniref:hypothetical protein n=1 Tax=Flavobacterium sp. W1B TaxID=3394146 RepID=UPI0039BD8BD5
MKFSTIHLGDNKIEVFNSYLGKETIKLNGEIVSEKSSITGAKHTFTIIENDRKVDCKLILGYGANGVVMDLYKDNIAIIESPRSSSIFILFLLVSFFLFVILSQIAFHYYS